MTESTCLWCGSPVTRLANFCEICGRKLPTGDADEMLILFAKFMAAENEAFKAAGKETGVVEFTCPICGGRAVGNRYLYMDYSRGPQTGNLGSGCTQCGLRHT